MESVSIAFSDGSTARLNVTPLGADKYRLEQQPYLVAETLTFGDVLELAPGDADPPRAAETDGEPCLRFVRVAEKSPYKHFSWVLPKDVAESTEVAEFLQAIEAAGGRWERAFVGFLTVALPKGCRLDAEAALDEAIATFSSRR